jgi:hypothetical protein
VLSYRDPVVTGKLLTKLLKGTSVRENYERIRSLRCMLLDFEKAYVLCRGKILRNFLLEILTPKKFIILIKMFTGFHGISV